MAVTDNLVGTCIQPAGVAVLISTAFAARAHARTTRVSGTRPRVAIVTVGAPANIARNVYFTFSKAIVDYASHAMCTPVTPFPADPIFSERGSDGMIPCAA